MTFQAKHLSMFGEWPSLGKWLPLREPRSLVGLLGRLEDKAEPKNCQEPAPVPTQGCAGTRTRPESGPTSHSGRPAQKELVAGECVF